MKTSETLAAILPLALGHDQEASACPWVRLTGRTADYPSRTAQAALAVASGAVPATPDIVDQLYRCDHGGRCRAASVLPGPPDLARTLWEVRALLVTQGAVPEIAPLAERQERFGNLFGDLSEPLARLGASQPGSDVLFVPGAATLALAPDAAVAAVEALREIDGGVEVRADCLDSGQTLRELGLAGKADEIQDHLRRIVTESGYRRVVAGTPKEAFGLQEALAGIAVEVRYVGVDLANRDLDGDGFERSVVFHPSETLIHRIDGFAVIDGWLERRLGDSYRRELDPKRNAWPAALERPAVRVPESLTRALAEQRLAQLESVAGPIGEGFVILTSDPYSWQALRAVAPPTVEIVDVFVFAAKLAGEKVRV